MQFSKYLASFKVGSQCFGAFLGLSSCSVSVLLERIASLRDLLLIYQFALLPTALGVGRESESSSWCAELLGTSDMCDANALLLSGIVMSLPKRPGNPSHAYRWHNYYQLTIISFVSF